jgi:hypothetical protein
MREKPASTPIKNLVRQRCAEEFNSGVNELKVLTGEWGALLINYERD